MRSDAEPHRIDLLPVLTFVLWLACLTVGLAGYWRSVAPTSRPVPFEARTDVRFVDVSLINARVSPASVAETRASGYDVPLPTVPPLPLVSDFFPAVVPVRLSASLKQIDFASRAPPRPATSGPTTSYRKIAYGSGAGKQPRPDYPIESQLAGQEGTVVVRFVVREDGAVTSAEVSRKCQWPLLDQAAERSIKENWTYPPGPERHYEISITYQQRHR